MDNRYKDRDAEYQSGVDRFWVSNFVTLLAVVITVFGGFLTFNHQWELNRRDRLISEAHKVADDLTVLLFDGYKQIDKFNSAVHYSTDWREFVSGPYTEYLTFKKGWRRDMIIMHYKVERYFGEDIADQLVNTEKLISGQNYEDLSSPSPCAMPPETEHSMMVLAESLECDIRHSAVIKTMIFKSSENLLENVNSNSKNASRNVQNLRIYDRNIVSYIRAINSRLTSLGEVSVKVDRE
ncbi:hypothetical protein [Pseudomonas sp. 58 R 3]|uniref:hypothetical protein n=1 Tax=Pseudomonas sp. 58 R 3 TaxID=1844108 RepID=UPI0011120A7F|nr:hypothetical protein [Pseudomonas sp. 58 R 3]